VLPKVIQEGTLLPENKAIYRQCPEEYVNELGASFSRRLAKGSLIIATSGTLGFCIFLGVEGCVHDGWIYLSEYRDATKPLFFYYVINQYRDYLNSLSYGAAIQNINTDIIRRLPVTLPTREVLEKFYSLAEPIHDKIFRLGLVNRNLEKSRNMLLVRLISGKVPVEILDIHFPPSMREDETELTNAVAQSG
jgi:type I restriction enzyme S subunit